MMAIERAIFFDLETSSLHKVGQILNFCFVVIDREFNELDRFKGCIAPTRLEIPDPMAIQATGIDIIELSNNAEYSEVSAMRRIDEFFQKWGGNDSIISGYNTEDFDIPFLRTSLLRNGCYPFAKHLNAKSTDVMIMIQYIMSHNDELRLSYQDYSKSINDSNKMSIRLEPIAKFLKLLDRPQSHESEDDVNITIDLAKLLNKQFNLSIFEFTPYRLSHLHEQTGKAYMIGYEKKSFLEPFGAEPEVFLRAEGNWAYWTKLKQYEKWVSEDRKTFLPIKGHKKVESLRFLDSSEVDSKYDNIGMQAFLELRNFKNTDLYPPKNVCTEQWIYNEGFNQLEFLCKSIKGDQQAITVLSKPLKELYLRYLLASFTDEVCFPKYQDKFNSYCNKRYGGKLKLYDESDRAPKGRPDTHLTFQQLFDELKPAAENVKGDIFEKEKLFALAQLEKYMKSSRVYTALH